MKTQKLMTMLFAFAIALALGACGDEDENNATANNVTTNNATTNNATTNNATTGGNATTGNNATTGTCGAGEAFDSPLDTCVTCPNTAYDCESLIALGDFDFETSTLTITPADGDASIVSATVGGQRPGDPQNPGEDFSVLGTVDGRTLTFDISAEETSNNMQLNNLVFTDSCGTEFDVRFVFNYVPGDDTSEAPYCPLGG